MSKIEIELCGCCERILDKDNRDGLAVEIKHSKGGWGQSKTLFSNNNDDDEICSTCYDELTDYLYSFINHWESLRGEHRPKEVKL